MKGRKEPKILVLTNESPDWPETDKEFAAKISQMLLMGLEEEGYEYRSIQYYDSLAGLEGFDPREWLVWNWGEELGGEPWSEWRVAAELERRGFAYTGATPETLRNSQSRAWVKQKLREADLPTLPAEVFADAERGAAEWRIYPAIVKGANQHASMGITGEAVVEDGEQLARRIRFLAERFHDEALVEPFLDSREFQVAVWGNEQPEALPPVEFDYSAFVDPHERLYTYDWKFDRSSRGYQGIRMPCPAPADKPEWRARLEELARRAYLALGLRDYGRIDFRMLGDEPQILDVNANPDLDNISVLLTAARTRGMGYGGMAAQIIRFAAERMPR